MNKNEKDKKQTPILKQKSKEMDQIIQNSVRCFDSNQDSDDLPDIEGFGFEGEELKIGENGHNKNEEQKLYNSKSVKNHPNKLKI